MLDAVAELLPDAICPGAERRYPRIDAPRLPGAPVARIRRAPDVKVPLYLFGYPTVFGSQLLDATAGGGTAMFSSFSPFRSDLQKQTCRKLDAHVGKATATPCSSGPITSKESLTRRLIEDESPP